MDYNQMSLSALKAELITEGKKGYPFFLAGALYWLVMGVLGFVVEDQKLLSLCYLIGTGSIFPLAAAIGSVFKVNIFNKNPLGVLGGIIGGIQAFYIPVWVVLYIEHPGLIPMAIGILGASHFLPYLWIYQSRTYLVLTVSMGVISFVFGYIFIQQAFVLLPFLLTALYLITVIALLKETRSFVEAQTTHLNQ